MTETARIASTRRGARNMLLVALGLLLSVAIVATGIVNELARPRTLTDAELRSHGAYMFDTPRAVPEFVLTDHLGRRFDPERLRGRWTLVFFGFTHCPDICPTTMARLSRLLEQLDGLPEYEDTRVVMVTVDPARDTVEQLSRYVPYFNPDFIGVTGELVDIRGLASALNTPFRGAPGQGAENYQVDHGANVALINPHGDYHGFFRTPLEPAGTGLAYRSVRAVWDTRT